MATQFLDATTHLYKRSCPSVRPVSFSTNMAVFEGKKSSNDIIIYDAMSEEVTHLMYPAVLVLPLTFFLRFSYHVLFTFSCAFLLSKSFQIVFT